MVDLINLFLNLLISFYVGNCLGYLVVTFAVKEKFSLKKFIFQPYFTWKAFLKNRKLK